MIEFKDMTSPTLTDDLVRAFNEPQDTGSEKMKSLVAKAKVYGAEKDAVKEAENKIKKRKADLREKELALFDMFQVVGITSIKAEGRTYFTRIDTYASLDAAKPDVAFKWIDEIGCDFLIKKTVNAQSLTREVKAYIEETGEIPGEEQGIKLRVENRVSAPKR
jgi:hypothetical protein